MDYMVPITCFKNCQNIASNSAVVVPENDNHSFVETYVAPKTLTSKIPIPMVEDKNNFNSDFNNVLQNDNLHLYLDVTACRKKMPMEYIWTFNSSAKFILKVP